MTAPVPNLLADPKDWSNDDFARWLTEWAALKQHHGDDQARFREAARRLSTPFDLRAEFEKARHGIGGPMLTDAMDRALLNLNGPAEAQLLGKKKQ